MDRYNYLKKLYNMSEETVKVTKQIPAWYARLKSRRVPNRIFSNAIADPNSQLIKALLFSEFKLPMDNNYNNIVDIFKAVLKSKHANQELIDRSELRTTNYSSLNSVAIPETRNNPLQNLANISVEIEEWWGERTEYWRVDETRFQRSSDAPYLYMDSILERLISGYEYETLDDLEEYIEDMSQDPDDHSCYETDNTEQNDEDYVETGNTETGYSLPGTMISILNRLRWFRDHPADPQSVMISNHIVTTSNNQTTLSGLIQLIEGRI